MNNITQFIKDALAGGWVWIDLPGYNNVETVERDHEFCFEIELLKPVFWQAVGKSRGWNRYVPKAGKPSIMWRDNMHRFIDALCDGKDIDTALGEISQ